MRRRRGFVGSSRWYSCRSPQIFGVDDLKLPCDAEFLTQGASRRTCLNRGAIFFRNSGVIGRRRGRLLHELLCWRFSAPVDRGCQRKRKIRTRGTRRWRNSANTSFAPTALSATGWERGAEDVARTSHARRNITEILTLNFFTTSTTESREQPCRRQRTEASGWVCQTKKSGR